VQILLNTNDTLTKAVALQIRSTVVPRRKRIRLTRIFVSERFSPAEQPGIFALLNEGGARSQNIVATLPG
jgi:hypothetical protein